MANIIGENVSEFIPGTDEGDNIQGLGGNDTIEGRNGNDTIFGDDGNDSILGGNGDDRLEGGAGADFIDGDGGFDLLSYTASDAGVRVFLQQGFGEGGHAEGDTFREVEGFLGSIFGDTVFLNANQNGLFLNARSGFDSLFLNEFQDLRNDTFANFERIVIADVTGGQVGFEIESDQLDGLEEFAIRSFVSSNVEIEINLVDNVNVDLSGIRMIGFDTNDFIRIRGENNFDNITGSDADDRIEANSGNDVARGGDGEDTIFGGNGNDQLFGDAGDDELRGGDGADLLEGGAGADFLVGDGGNDTVSYAQSDAAVNVILNRGVGEGGHAQGDTFSGIDGFIGSDFGDRLRLQDNRSNLLLDGGGGLDTLELNEFQDLRNDTVANFERIVINDVTSGRKGFDINSDQLAALIEDGLQEIAIFGRSGDVDIFIDVVNGVDVDLSGITMTGFDPDDIIRVRGENDADVMTGSVADELFDAGSGNDLLEGRGGDDNLQGDNGRDTLIGGTGDDTLTGGDGDDFLEGGEGADVINGGDGEDVINYAASNAAVGVNLDTQKAAGGHAEGDTISNIDGAIGSDFADVITGSGRNNQLAGGEGNDTINGRNGNDTILGGAGADSLDGEGGNDVVDGGEGDDDIQGGDGNDILVGGDGADTLSGERGDDAIDGGDGNDNIQGGDNNDKLEGGAGNDILSGDAGNDTLSGGAGNDRLLGGAGVDVLNGGAGFDVASYKTASAAVRVDLNNPSAGGGDADGDSFVSIEVIEGSNFGDQFIGDFLDNRFRGGDGADTIDGGFGDDAVDYVGSTAVNIDLTRAAQEGGDAEGDVLVNIEDVFGSSARDEIRGDAKDNFLRGGAGNDILRGREGDDLIRGEIGNDNIAGNDGDDTLEGGSGEDILSGGDGNDILDGGDGIDLLSAGLGNDILDGGDATDRLFGGEGNDTLTGGGGSDLIDGGAGTDTARFIADFADYVAAVDSEGRIRLTNQAGEVDLINNVEFFEFADGIIAASEIVEALTPTDPTEGDDLLIGTEGADVIDALGGDDTVDAGRGNDDVSGGTGNDQLTGGFGADILQGGEGNDTLDGGFQNDTLDGGAGIDTASYAGFGGGIRVNLSLSAAQSTGAGGTDTLIDIENLLGGQFNDTLTGSIGAGGDNLLEGDGGSDRLFGLGGDDTLDGGAGNDVMQGGNGADVLIGGAGRDIMVGGGGADSFVFEDLTDSAVGGQRDRINDFDQGVDVIDLSAIDAIAGGGDDAFTFVGRDTFGGTAGELRQIDLTNRTVIAGDTDGDGAADFQIELFNAALTLGQDDFQL